MKRRNTLHPAPEERRLRLRDKMMILSRLDRMGKAKPTWYRVLAAVAVLALGLVLLNGSRVEKLKNRSVSPEPLINGTVRLSFAGDLYLSRSVAALGRELGYDTLFKGVSPLWADSSLVFSNLEGVVLPEDTTDFPAADSAENPSPVSPAALSAAAGAGVEAVCVPPQAQSARARSRERHRQRQRFLFIYDSPFCARRSAAYSEGKCGSYRHGRRRCPCC